MQDDINPLAEYWRVRRWRQSSIDSIGYFGRSPHWNDQRISTGRRPSSRRILFTKRFARLLRHSDVRVRSWLHIYQFINWKDLNVFQGYEIVSKWKDHNCHPAVWRWSTGQWSSDFTIQMPRWNLRRLPFSFPLVVEYRLSHLRTTRYQVRSCLHHI